MSFAQSVPPLAENPWGGEIAPLPYGMGIW
jgi:hypothetical protein